MNIDPSDQIIHESGRKPVEIHQFRQILSDLIGTFLITAPLSILALKIYSEKRPLHSLSCRTAKCKWHYLRINLLEISAILHLMQF